MWGDQSLLLTSRAPLGRTEQVLIYLGVLGMLMVPSEVRATAGDCDCPGTPDPCHATFTMTTPGNHYKFKINTDNAASYGLTSSELSQAAQLAAAIWNDKSNGATFEYDGSTSATDASCTGAGWSLVNFTNDQSGSLAGQFDGRCASGGTWGQFRIRTYRRNTQCCGGVAPPCNVGCPGGQTCEAQTGGGSLCVRTFGNGADIGGRDVVGLLVHEFGHVQGLGHPDNGEYATMVEGVMASAHWRDLYEWDLTCAHPTSSDRRARTGRYRTVTSTFSGESSLTSANAVTKASSGRTWTGSVWQWASGQHRRTLVGHDENLGNSPATVTGIGLQNAVGFVSGVFRETASTDRLFYSYAEDFGTDYLVTSEHAVLQARSTSSFSSAPDSLTYLKRCSGMGASFLTCDANPTIEVMSAHRLAVGWLAAISRTVIAWVDTDHGGNCPCRTLTRRS